MRETKVLVNELPECCWDCPCFDSYELQCQINYADCENLDIAIERHKDCPLHSIKDYDRELVAKVCDKFRKWCKNIREWTYDSSHRVLDLHNLDEFLEQTKKEFEYE